MVAATLADVTVEVRDGVALATDVYLPEGDGPFPAILTRLPYGKTEDYCRMPWFAEQWTAAGYAAVVQDCRGKWGSGGTFDASDIDMEAKDGFDTIAWLRAQPWSNGRVGMTGESYYGYTCFAAASLQPEGLVCIAPGDQGFERYHWSYRSGCLRLASEGIWGIHMMGRTYADMERIDLRHLPLADLASAAGVPCTYFDDVIAHPDRHDRYWQARNRLDAMLAIRIPVLHWTGWHDNFMGHMVEEWRWLAEANAPARHNHLLLGPWDHEGTPDLTHKIGLNKIAPDTGAHRWRIWLSFFERYLKGIDNGFGEAGAIHYFTIGADAWCDAATWPPAGAGQQFWYLHAGGRLDRHEPGDEAPDGYVYDPQNPVDWTVGSDAWRFAEAMTDRSAIAERPDVLAYTSEPLTHDTEITGPLSALLHVSSDAPDTDFTVALVDVLPDGRANLIQDGIQRAARRDPAAGRQLLEPDGIYELAVDMWSISYRLPAGHRLRVEISSSEFDRYDRNPNTAAPFGRETQPVAARQTVHHDRRHPSRILLPVMAA